MIYYPPKSIRAAEIMRYTEREPQLSVAEFQWFNTALVGTQLLTSQESTRFFASRELVQQLYDPQRVLPLIRAAYENDIKWSKITPKTLTLLTTWLTAAQHELVATYQNIEPYMQHLSGNQECQLLCFLSLLLSPQELQLERIIDTETAHMVIRQAVKKLRSEAYVTTAPAFVTRFLLCDMSAGQTTIDGLDKQYYAGTLCPFLDDVRLKIQSLLGESSRERHVSPNSHYGGAVKTNSARQYLERLGSTSFATQIFRMQLARPTAFEQTVTQFLQGLLAAQDAATDVPYRNPRRLEIYAEHAPFSLEFMLNTKQREVLKIGMCASQRVALERFCQYIHENPPQLTSIATSTGERYGVLTFAPVFSSIFIDLLHAVTPSTGVSYGRLADIPYFTQADWQDEKAEILELHDQIPGWAEFQQEKSLWLAALSEGKQAFHQVADVEISLWHLLDYATFSYTPEKTLAYTKAQTLADGLQRKAFAALLSQMPEGKLLEKLIQVIKQGPSHGSRGCTQFETVINGDVLEVLAYHASPKNVPVLLFSDALCAENKLEARFPDGKIVRYAVTPELEFGRESIRELKARPIEKSEHAEQLFTPLLCWKLGENDPTPRFKEAVLPNHPQLAATALPSEVREQLKTLYGSSWSALLGGLAAAAVCPPLLAEWAPHQQLGTKGKRQKMAEPQVPLFPAWFRNQTTPLLQALEARLPLE
jgi:hypothetical protein